MRYAKRAICASLAVAGAVVITVSFFQPWACAYVNGTRIARGVTGRAGEELRGIPFLGEAVDGLVTATAAIAGFGDIEMSTTVTGYDIPGLVRKRSSRVAAQLGGVLSGDAKDPGSKAFLVLLFPVCAVVCAAFALIGLVWRAAIAVMSVLSGAMGAGGFYLLLSTDFTRLPVRITIEYGLWQTLYGYIWVCFVGLLWFLIDRRR